MADERMENKVPVFRMVDEITERVTQGLSPPFDTYPSRRSVVHSANGIVACSQPLAAQAGLKILREGGNAAVSDAL
jgi:gamma-glutamyltranspeptidase